MKSMFLESVKCFYNKKKVVCNNKARVFRLCVTYRLTLFQFIPESDVALLTMFTLSPCVSGLRQYISEVLVPHDEDCRAFHR